jgi:hypothetical protein
MPKTQNHVATSTSTSSRSRQPKTNNSKIQKSLWGKKHESSLKKQQQHDVQGRTNKSIFLSQ